MPSSEFYRIQTVYCILDLKPNADQTTASHHCNSAAPETGPSSERMVETKEKCPLEEMAVALGLNFCFFVRSKLSVLLVLALWWCREPTFAFCRAQAVPGCSTEPVSWRNVHVFFPQSDHFQQWLLPACSEKVSGWLKISLWPEGYGLLKVSCLKKTNRKKPPNRRSCFELSSIKGAVDSRMACFFGDTLRPSQWIYLNSCFLNRGEESSVWREFLCSRVQDFCVQRAGQTVCLRFPREHVARACLAASDSQSFPQQSGLLPPPWVYQPPGKPSRQLGPRHSQTVYSSPCAMWAVIPAFAKKREYRCSCI